MPGRQVEVIGSDGEVYSVSEEQLGQVMFEDEGARMATPGEIKTAQRQAAGDFDDPITAVPFGITRGVTGGLSDVVIPKVAGFLQEHGLDPGGTPLEYLPPGRALSGGEEGSRETLGGIRAANPLASTAGEIYGFVGPIVAGGVGGPLAKGATSLTGGGLTALVGEGAEALTSRVLGEGLVSRLGGAAVRGAAENYVMGVSERLSEEALGSPNLNAEKIFTEGAGLDLLLGGAFGGALQGGGELLKVGGRATKSAVGALAEKLWGEPSPEAAARVAREGGGASGVKKLLIDVSAGLSGSDPQVIESFFDAGGAAKRARVVFGAEESRARAVEAVRQGLDDLGVKMPELSEEFKGPMKAEYIEKLVKKGNEDEVFRVAMGHIKDLREGLNEIDNIALRDVKGAFGQSMDTLRKWADYVENQIKVASEGGKKAARDLGKGAQRAGGEGWEQTVRAWLDKKAPGLGKEVLDAPTKIEGVGIRDFKPPEGFNGQVYMALDSLKRVQQQVAAMRYEMIPDAINRQNAMRIHDMMVKMSEGVRTSLEDEQVWGKAAAAQKRINGTWASHIQAERDVKRQLMRQMQDIQNKADPFKMKWIGDPEKIGPFIHNVVAPEKDLVRQTFRNYVSSAREMAEAMNGLDLPPEKRKVFQEAVRAATKLEGSFERAVKEMSELNQYQKLQGSHGFMPALVGIGLGHLVGGPAGLLAGAVANLLANPKRGIAMLAAIEKISKTHLGKVAEGVQEWLGKRSGKRLVHKVSRKDISKIADHLQNMGSSDTLPQALYDMLKVPKDLAGAAPNTHTAIPTVAMRVISYLTESIPKQSQVSTTVVPYKRRPLGETMSDMEVHQLGQRIRIARHGSEAVAADMGSGRLGLESVRALERMYPEQLDELRQITVAQVMNQTGGDPKKMGYEQRLELSLLLGKPIEYTQTTEFMRAMQDIKRQPPSAMMKAAGMNPELPPKTEDTFDEESMEPMGDQLQKAE